MLADLETEHWAADAQIIAALACPGGSPKSAGWLYGRATAAGITGLPRTPTGRLQVTADTLTVLLAEHAAVLPAGAADLARARLAASKASNLIANLRGFLAAGRPGRPGTRAGQYAARQDGSDEHHEPDAPDAQENMTRGCAGATGGGRGLRRSHVPPGHPGINVALEAALQ